MARASGSRSTGTAEVPGQGGLHSLEADWRIERFGSPLGTYAWWDDVDPDILWSCNTIGQYRYFDFGTGNITDAFTINGYTLASRTRGQTGAAMAGTSTTASRAGCARRNADNAFVLTRINLNAGTKTGERDPD